MAYVITDECTACGVCPQVCPNDAIAVCPAASIVPAGAPVEVQHA